MDAELKKKMEVMMNALSHHMEHACMAILDDKEEEFEARLAEVVQTSSGALSLLRERKGLKVPTIVS